MNKLPTAFLLLVNVRAIKMSLILSALYCLETSVSNGQSYQVLRSFGILTNISGMYPKSTLVQGSDGMLYGTTGPEHSISTVFKIRPDGSEFGILKWFTNSTEGANPSAGLALDGATLYGTTTDGGVFGYGTVFKVNTDGSGFAVIKSFSKIDGANPVSSLVISEGIVYGTTPNGGNSGLGTAFKLNTDGTGYKVLRSFSSYDGGNPYGTLALVGNELYGTTYRGGTENAGTIFRLRNDGTEFTLIRSFSSGNYDESAGIFTNSEGAYPSTGLTISGTTIYGTTSSRSRWGFGGLFKINIDGTGYTVLHDFTFDDGMDPQASLTLFENALYGTTKFGGSLFSVFGTVFKINTDGTEFSVLRQFSFASGYRSYAGLLISNGSIYGTTSEGGAAGDYGTVFKMNKDGSDYTILKNFGFSDGVAPTKLILSGNTLFGTTFRGGGAGYGTVFRLDLNGGGYRTIKSFGASNGGYPRDLISSGETLYGTATADNGVGTIFKMKLDGLAYAVLRTLGASNGQSAYPSLALAGETLYGTTYLDGPFGLGTLFKINTDGTGYSVMKNFNDNTAGNPIASMTPFGSVLYGTTSSGTVFKIGTNSTGYAILKRFTTDYLSTIDGGSIWAGVVLSGNTLFGVSYSGGASGAGTIFKLNTNGTDFRVLRQLPALTVNPSTRMETNIDGASPITTMVLRNDRLYGSTSAGGAFGNGTIFTIKTDGTDFAVLKTFNGRDGSGALSLIFSGSALYGTSGGGDLDEGLVFKIEFGPVISIQPQGSASVCGSNVTLAVSASGPESLSFQWYRNTDAINSATNDSYSFAADAETVGGYTVVVGNSYGSVTSSIANVVLVDTSPPVVLSVPTNQILEADANCRAILPDLRGELVASDCSGHVTIFQEPAPQTLIAVGTTTVTLSAADASNNSTNVRVTVTVKDVTAPMITRCPSNQTITVGANCLGIVTDMTTDMRAQDCNGPIDVKQNPPPGTLVPLGATNVQFQVTDAAGNASACSTLLTVVELSLPLIIFQPQNQTNLADSDVSFNVTAVACSMLNYQWIFNGTNILNETNSILNIKSAETTNAGSYHVIICNSFGCVTSSIALLHVDRPPIADAGATLSLVLSGNGTNGTLVLDGSRSFDADGDELTYYWFLAGQSNLLASGRVVLVVLPVGTNSITLEVSDGVTTAGQMISVEIITSGEAVDRILALVGAEVPHDQSLIASLSSAIASIDRSNPISAINQLEAFQNKIRAQLLPLDPTLAETFIHTAQDVIDVLSGTTDNSSNDRIMNLKIERSLQVGGATTRVRFVGLPGRIHFVEASNNLTDWDLVGLALDDGDGNYEFEETEGAWTIGRFYRIVIP